MGQECSRAVTSKRRPGHKMARAGATAAIIVGAVCALETVSAFAPSLRHTPFALPTLRPRRTQRMDVSMSAKKVLIVGAGPAGLLAAHHLLLKGQPGAFDVTVAERRADPRESKQASKRSYSLGLGVRGRSSIKDVSASLWELVKTRGVECERFSLHLGRRVLQIRQTSPQLISEPSVLINRADLCAALLDGFEDKDIFTPKVQAPTLLFERQCISVDCKEKVAVFQGPDSGLESVPYDVLLGADGVNSAVRNALLASEDAIRYAQAPLNGTLKTIHQKMPVPLDPLSVHAMSGVIPSQDDPSTTASERLGLFWVPERNRTTGELEACALVTWSPESQPTSLLSASSAVDAQALLNAAFPTLEDGITLEAAEQFVQQQPAVNFVNKLSQYHGSSARIGLLGDAAHCTGGASGQGCNSALEDAACVAELLHRHSDAGKALQEFSEARVAQGHALLDLAVTANSPKAPLLRLGFLLLNGLEGLGHKLLPALVAPPTQNLLTQTALPFTEIYRKKAWVLDVIRASNIRRGVFKGY